MGRNGDHFPAVKLPRARRYASARLQAGVDRVSCPDRRSPGNHHHSAAVESVSLIAWTRKKNACWLAFWWW